MAPPSPGGHERRLGLRHLAQPLHEAPAVTLGIERLVRANRRLVVQPCGNSCTRRDRALVMRVDAVDGHAAVLALDAAAHRTDGAAGALRAAGSNAASRRSVLTTGSSSAAATLWYERSSHAKSRSASRSPSGSVSMASATRGKSRR